MKIIFLKINNFSASVASRPGKHGRADGYILEGKEFLRTEFLTFFENVEGKKVRVIFF